MKTITKEAAVVMLPSTDSKKDKAVKFLWLQPNTKELYYLPSQNSVDCIGQHLYFVTNEQIKPGNWLIFFGNDGNELHRMHSDSGYGLKTYTKVSGYDTGTLIVAWSKCRKVVATTDSKINLVNHPHYFNTKIELPTDAVYIHTDFIKEFAAKQGAIDTVQLLYDAYNRSTTWEHDEPEIVTIRKTKDNCCVLAPDVVKKYSPDEVQAILEDYDREFKLQTFAYTQIDKFQDSPSEWFKKKYTQNS